MQEYERLLLSPSGDRDWLLIEEGVDLAREREIESILATANGYLGIRASIAEGGKYSRPSIFVAGIYVVDKDLGPNSPCFHIGCASRSRWRTDNYRSASAACSSIGDYSTCVRALCFGNGGSRTRADASPG